MRAGLYCVLLGAPSAAGAALFGRSALLAAESSPDDPFNSWAVQASSEMESKYTCNVSAILPRFEHESWEKTGDSWGKDFLLPPNTHLFLYGTSQIRSVRQVLVSMARYQGTFERSRLVDISDHCGSGSGPERNFLDRVLAEAALEGLTCVPGTCAMCGIQKQKCKHADHTVDYFAGNSTVTTISDMAQYQKVAHLGALEGLLKQHQPAFTHAYFWAPNDESYFDMQCAKLAVSRDPLRVQKLTRAFQGATQAQCDFDDEECRQASPYFQALRKAVPPQALGFVGRPKKRATELEEMSGYFETQQEEAWCNVVCKEGDATQCSPSAGVPFAWEVLRSAGVLEPEMVVAAPPAEKAVKPKAQQQQAATGPNDALSEIMEKAEAEQKALAVKEAAKEAEEREEIAAEKAAYDKAAAAAEFEEAEAAAKEATAKATAVAAAAAAEKEAAKAAETAAAAAVEKEAATAEKKALAKRVEDAEAEAVGKVAKAEARAAAAEQRADAETSAAAAKKSKAQAAAAAVASAAASVAAQAAKEEKEMETEKKALAQASAEENRRLADVAGAKIEAAEERAAQAEARAEAEALAAQKAEYDAAAAAEEKEEAAKAAKADADLKVAKAEARVAEAEGKAEEAVAAAEKRVAEAEANAEARAVKQDKVAAQQQAAAAADGTAPMMAVPLATAPGDEAADGAAPSAPAMRLPGFEAEAKEAEAKAKAAQRREAEAEARAAAAEEREAVVKAEAQAEAAEAQAEAAEAKAEAAEAKAAAKDAKEVDAKATVEEIAARSERDEIAAEKAAYDAAEAKAQAQAQEDATAEATAKAAAEAAETETADALAEADAESASSALTKAEAEAQAAEAEAYAEAAEVAGFVDADETEAAAEADVRIARAEAEQAEGAAAADDSEQQAAVQQVSPQQAAAEALATRQSEAEAEAQAQAEELAAAAGVPLVPMTPFEQAQAASQKAADDAKAAWAEAAAQHEETTNAEAARNTESAESAQKQAEKLRTDKVKADAAAAAANAAAEAEGAEGAQASAAEAAWEAQSQAQASQQEAVAGAPVPAGPSGPMASLANPPAFSFGPREAPADLGLMGQDGEVPEVFVPLQGASPQQARSVKIQPPHLAVPQLARADDMAGEGYQGMQQQGVAAGARSSGRHPQKALVAPLDAAAEGPRLSLPSTYYINMDEEVDMKRRIERELSPYTDKLVRVPAVDKARVGACLDDGSCSRDPNAKVLGRDFLNTDGFLYWELHEKNIFSPGEFGCTFSHLRAAYQAYIDDEQTALIIEDDVSIEDMSHWPETIQDIVAEAPPDWGILQLWTNNPAFYKFYQRGQSVDEVPAEAKNGFDPNSATCEADQYNRPAFVPWYDDVFQNTGQYYGGLWSTMAYLINRKGMNSIITKLGVGPNRLGNLTLPVLADHLVFQVAKTYTYTRPLFRAFSRESTIQPSFHEGDAKIDPTKGRVESGDDPHWATDGLTNKFINQYWSEPQRSSACPLVAAGRSPLKLVVLATAAFSEAWIHDGNIEKLARGVEGTRVVLYAINAIDNKVADWHTGWTQKAERLGIANMVVSSKRNLDRGFESKLVSQLPLLAHIKQRVSYDYIFTIDGDISFADADVHGLFRSIRSARPLIAQPTIRVPASLIGGNMFSWGSQWYKALNHDQASTCGSAVEYDSPMIESQAAILSKTFLDWYHDELEQVARVQHEYQCDWGHDEMWCSAAARLSEKLPHSPPACLIIRHSVDHHDTKSIQKYQMHTNGGNFLSDCQTMEKAFQKDNIGGDGAGKGKVTRISIAALRDHTNLTCVNQWADLNGGGCKPPSHDGSQEYSAVKSYRAFMQGEACHNLQDEKAAAEESYALTKLRRPKNPFISERVMGVPGAGVPVAAAVTGAAEAVAADMRSTAAGVGAAADMLSKGRREFGPHFTPKMPLTQAPVAPVPPARSAVSEADLPTGLESLRKALRGPHRRQ